MEQLVILTFPCTYQIIADAWYRIDVIRQDTDLKRPNANVILFVL